MPPKKSAVCIAFGGAVRSFRREQRYSQERFADHASIDRSYYGAIERGEVNVSLDTIVKLAKALNVSGATLLARAGL
jgi:transcriptional regulator with XRE-family HTH domain